MFRLSRCRHLAQIVGTFNKQQWFNQANHPTFKKNEKSFSFWPPGAKHCMLSKPIRNHGSIWRMGTGHRFLASRHIQHGNIIDTACNRLLEQSSQGSLVLAWNLGWETWKFHFRNASLDSEIASLSKQSGPFHQGMQSPGSKWMACGMHFYKKKNEEMIKFTLPGKNTWTNRLS